VAPGVYDGYSAMVADRSACEVLYLTGYSVAASRYGVPDAGLVGLREMLDAIAVVRRVSAKPLVADADTGYGGLLNVQQTVREYERLGVAAVQLEDQLMPKKCGHTPGKKVTTADEMAAKVTVAAEARRSRETLIVARTDAAAEHGLAEAIDRAHRYREAGADVLFVEAPRSREDVATVARELAPGGPVLLNVVPARGFETPVLPAAEIEALGFALAIYPLVLALAAAGAMERAVTRLAEHGDADPADAPDLDVHELVGFPAVWEDESRWAARFGG